MLNKEDFRECEILIRVIDSYIWICREAIGEFSGRSNEEFQTSKQKHLRIAKEVSYNRMLDSFFLLEDTQIAKKNFYEFTLTGPARYKNIGEEYLRLYGMLSCYYLQRDAIFSLTRILKNPTSFKLKEQGQELKIVDLRNKVASHTTWHKGPKEAKQSFFINRSSLCTKSIMLQVDGEDFEEFNIPEIVYEFENFLANSLEVVSEDLIKRLSSVDENQFTKYMGYCYNVKKMKNGEIFWDYRKPEAFINFSY